MLGGGAGSQIIGVGVRFAIVGGGIGSQMIGVNCGVAWTVGGSAVGVSPAGTVEVGGGGTGSQIMGERQPLVAALPERMIEIRRYFWSDLGSLSQGIMVDLQSQWLVVSDQKT